MTPFSVKNGSPPSTRSAEHGFMSSVRSAENGFTLVEMLISVAIFALLAAAGVALMTFSVRAQQASDAKLAQIAQLNQLGSALTADLAQVRARQTRDPAGNPLPVFTGTGNSDGNPMLRFVRAGWSNLDDKPRPTEQKVEYRLDGGTLERVAYPMLDGAQPQIAARILDGVSRIALRYRFDGAWSDTWNGTVDRPLPDAVEMTISQGDGPGYRELFLVGTGYRTALERGS